MSEPARWFIGVATTLYTPESTLQNRPELADELQRMADLFGRLGYRLVAGFGLNLARRVLEDRFTDFVTDPERSEDDIIVVYYTGHGVLNRDDLLLPMIDTDARQAQTAVFAEDLAGRWLRDTPIRNVLYILDTCYSGAGGTALAGQAHAFVNSLKAPITDPSIAVIVSARMHEQASAAAFTRAFAEAVNSPATGGSEPDFLPLDEVLGVANDTTPAYQHARLLANVKGPNRFLPNPRLDPSMRDADLYIQQQRRIAAAAASRSTLLEHVIPRAQGLDTLTPDTEDRWLFTGRHRALAAASAWLRSPTPPSLVVTGGPGSGKSALLARLYVLTDSRLRQRVPDLERLPTDTLPPDNVITGFVHARGKTPDEIFAEIRDACGMRDQNVTRPGQLLQALRTRDHPLVVVIDALDEAIGAGEHDQPDAFASYPVVDQVIAPLLAAAHRTRLRLLVGTRRHLLVPLDVVDRHSHPTGLSDLIDLDAPGFVDVDDLSSYAWRVLIDLVNTSPYRDWPRPYQTAVADAVARAAGTSFLVALVTARSLALRTETVADPHDPAWRSGLPNYADEAMRADLDDRLGLSATKARDLLLPLAYARGTGLPWADIWPQLATRLALTNTSYTSSDIFWVIEHAGFYILEVATGDQRRSVYRLYHEALAEHILSTRLDPVGDHIIVVDTLTDHTPRLADGQIDWAAAHPYTLQHLATHAMDTNRLDGLTADPRFLLAARPSPLLNALRHTRTPAAHAAADAYRRAEPRMRTCPESHKPAYLQLSARCGRAPQLADAITSCNLPLAFTTNWAICRLQSPHHALTGHASEVNAVATGQVGGRDVIVSTAGRTIQVWNAATGTPIGDPFAGHTDIVNAVAIGRIDGRDVIVSGSDDRTVRVWDAVTGAPVGDPFTGHAAWVWSVTMGRIEGRDVIVSGAADATVRVWDAASGTLRGEPFTGHVGRVRAVAMGQAEGRTVIVSGSDDRTVQVWDAATGAPVGDPFTGHTDRVRSVTMGRIAGRDVIVSGGDDATVRVWDATTGSPVGNPYTGHTDIVNAVVIGRIDGRDLIVSGSEDRTVQVWDTATGTPVGNPFTGHTDTVNTLAIGRIDGRDLIVSGSDDRTVRVWDTATGTPVGDPYTGHTAWVWSVAAGRIDGRDLIISGGADATVRVWDAATGSPVGSPFIGHTDVVRSVAIGRIGRRDIIVSGSDDRTVRVWDPDTGTPLGNPFTGHTGEVNAVSIGEVGGRTVIVTGSADATVRIWDAATGTLVGEPITGHTARVRSVAIGRIDGRDVVAAGSADRTVRIWEMATGAAVGNPCTGHTGEVNTVAIGRIDGRDVVVSGSDDRTIRVWDARTGTRIGKPFTGPTGWVWSVAMGRIDGRDVIVSASDRTVRVWDAVTGAALGDALSGHTDEVFAVSVARVGDQTMIVSGGADRVVRVWDVVTRNPVGNPFAGHATRVRSAVAGRIDGRNVIVSGGDDAMVRVWDAATGIPVGDPFTGHTGKVNAVAIGQVGDRTVIVSGGDDATVQMRNAGTRDAIGKPFTGHAGAVNAVAIGRHVVVSGGDDGMVRVWGPATGALIGEPLTGHAAAVNTVAIGYLGAREVIVSGSEDRTVRMWDASTGDSIGTPLTGHTGAVNTIAIGHLGDRSVIVSGSDDRTIRMWDASTGNPIGTPLTGHTSWVRSVAIGRIGSQDVIVSGSEDATVRVWDAATGAPACDSSETYGSVTPMPNRVDLAIAVTSVTATENGPLIIATELGLISLQIGAP